MSIFQDEKMTRLTISIPHEQRDELVEMAKRAGHGISIARVARSALGEGLRELRGLMADAPKCQSCGQMYHVPPEAVPPEVCPECGGTLAKLETR